MALSKAGVGINWVGGASTPAASCAREAGDSNEGSAEVSDPRRLIGSTKCRAIAALAALLPARRAARLQIVRAIQYE